MLKKYILPAALVGAFLATTQVVHASIVEAFRYSDELNSVTLTNREAIFRGYDTESALTTDGRTLAFVGADGRYYSEVVGSASDPIAVDDVFVQIFDGTTLNIPTTPSVWIQTDTDRCEAYAVQQFTGVDGGLLQFGAAASDPFGVLGAGEVLALYADSGAGATKIDETTSWQTGVTSVTDGAKWATFGLGLANDFAQGGATSLGYAESIVTVMGNFVTGTGWYGLNVMYTSQPGLVFTGVSQAFDPASDNSLYAQASFSNNSNYGSTSVWRYQSSDPLAFKAVPEPTSLAAWGLLMACAAGFRTWRRKSR